MTCWSSIRSESVGTDATLRTKNPPGRRVTQADLLAAQPEAAWSAQVKEYALLMGWTVYSFEAPFAAVRKSTLVDLWLVHTAWKRACWVELKAEGKRPTPKQREFLE